MNSTETNRPTISAGICSTCSSVTAVPVVVVLALLQLVDVSPLQQEFLFLDDQQRSADASGVRVDPDLSLSDISDHGYLEQSEPAEP